MSEESSSAGPLGDLHPYKNRFETFSQLPQQGRDFEEIYDVLKTMADLENQKWAQGQVSGTYYHGGLEHYDRLNHIFNLFSHVNLLQRDLCPSGTKLESEITAMVARMLNGEAAKAANPRDEVCGSVTSGGTESILNAMLVYREWGREKGITQPEVVAPTTIHPAFLKGAHYLGIKLIRTPVNADYEADVQAMRAQITPNTVALAGSAGNYPYGVIDPLPALSELALEHGIGMHVDGCLGGFILPWIEKLGYDIPPFDFRLEGVTSMSCDTHKYGYALKGTSVVLYRNEKLRRFQYFSCADWSGGVYGSPTFQGSRSAGLSAATWAAMVTTGEAGYLEHARAIMTAADKIRAGIARIPELKIFGKSTFVIAVTSDVVDIYHVNDYLASKGWRMNGCQNPPGFHFCVTLRQTLPGVAESYIDDLAAGVEYAKNPPQPFPMSGAIYGLAGTLEGQETLSQLIYAWLDATYSLP
ncbi:MAG: aspartate aminotransferase family protein [Anaerolineales bacterium]|nr:aspartate aminotransferase family protein [Anaerolineales bacterium]